MSRKSLILCLSALAVLLLGLGAAIAFLYSGTGNDGAKDKALSGSSSFACLSAVPSDAVAVSCFEHAGMACAGILSSFDFPSVLSRYISDGTLASLRKSPMAVSMHYAGKLSVLYVIDVSRASDDAVVTLTDLVKQASMCSGIVSDYMVISASETLVKSSLRHYEKNVSVADAPAFVDALASVSGGNVLLVSNLHCQKLMTAMFTGKISGKSAFFERVGDWLALEVNCTDALPVSLNGTICYDADADEFMSVIDGCTPGVSDIGDVLPSYTLFAVALPVRNFDEYISAYQTFVDSRQGLQNFKSAQKTLGSKAGMMPEDFFNSLDLKEIGTASFVVGSRLEKVNLFHVGRKDSPLFSKDGGAWVYPGFAGSVFGKFFTLPDESCYTYADGWIVTGSKAAIDEYTGNNALDYTLNEYMSDAGRSGLLSSGPSLVSAYFSITENPDGLSSYFKPEMLELLSGYAEGFDYVPIVFSLGKDKKGITVSAGIHTLTLQKTKAPSHERDTVVTVPAGPFKVRNSGTGKDNMFYQNAQKAICLRDENGKDLWGVPFGKSICGTAHNVDYYANGKLQIIFAAGSSIYIIDRLGRYVKGFPLDLGKEIVLGPDVYDFSGAKKYNIMVLHKDNTIAMYNLKGKKPEAWKGITAEETIKALPERLTVGGKDFWVVRTSIQTLIFPFYGGEPLTVFEGNSKIRPDSAITVADGTSVHAECYDGKTRTIKLK